jgi:4-hydroxybenzoate polyprenyltransferase
MGEGLTRRPGGSRVQRIALVLHMIKIEHSVFALPFALVSALVAAGGFPSARRLVWIVVAMIAARSCAMAFNRLADISFDRLNPRTRDWPLPAGRISAPFVAGFIAVCCAIFVFSAYMLNRLALVLSPVALAIIFGYSLTKRFTVLSHWFIGLALAVAPCGAWIAIRGTLQLPPVLLSSAVLFWTAGFDLIYSCQDAEFDRKQKLFSVPSRYGTGAALLLSAASHVLTVAFLLAFGHVALLGAWYYAGVGLVSALLFYEHLIVRPGDLSRANEAFFTINGFVGVLFLLFAALDLFL